MLILCIGANMGLLIKQDLHEPCAYIMGVKYMFICGRMNYQYLHSLDGNASSLQLEEDTFAIYSNLKQK